MVVQGGCDVQLYISIWFQGSGSTNPRLLHFCGQAVPERGYWVVVKISDDVEGRAPAYLARHGKQRRTKRAACTQKSTRARASNLARKV